jgi:hypothetical protein
MVLGSRWLWPCTSTRHSVALSFVLIPGLWLPYACTSTSHLVGFSLMILKQAFGSLVPGTSTRHSVALSLVLLLGTR